MRYSVPALIVLWFALPAVQYLGTLQRTALFTQRDVVPGPLVDLDLTPWYVALLGLTIAHFAVSRLLANSERSAAASRSSQSAFGAGSNPSEESAQ